MSESTPPPTPDYDVVIVGAGLAGSIIAYQLGSAGKKVLVIDSGVAVPTSREAYMERFYTALAKTPESPYPDNPNAPRATVLQLGADGAWKDPAKTYLDQSSSTLPFSSTYERRGGGTFWHWLGSSFRFLPDDFKLETLYGHGKDWPINYDDLGQPLPGNTSAYYDMAEHEIGVSANVADQGYHGVTFTPGYEYPNPGIPLTLTDEHFLSAVNGKLSFEGEAVTVYPTPAGRNSRPYEGRRVCAGNTNCIPICPIQAKYDPTVTLNKALNTGNVTVIYQAVADKVLLDDAHQNVVGIHYITYTKETVRSPSGEGVAVGKTYVLAAHAIETPKLLLNSRDQLPAGVANVSGQVGCNLMDHPLFLRWGLTPESTFPYRGPLATAGIESLRTGAFRKERAAFRVEFGNEGWNFTAGDPETTTLDWTDGTNHSGTNPDQKRLFGTALIDKLNDLFTRQFRFGFLVEQSPEDSNTVTLSDLKDELGIPRPKINYNLSDYTKRGFVAAQQLTDEVFQAAGVTPFTKPLAQLKLDPGYFTYTDPVTGKTSDFEFFGSGHIVGTCRMGDCAEDSVINRHQQSWNHPNLFITGSTIFPTIATGNPSLTIAALAFWAADNVKAQLGD
ncbi:GMC family oxidoreductase [Synoicihabitans lomoniglobus]|uniref:GMC family oxidoreductase n=1 Tax=Synoicihabitans lomoniglobus TaxID=2909285 RepID=A0AAE9ZY45_9BACT|nr:GMC family oxidoreductase [Opitutaceae bacterium LMO-M01]WED65140.1 GMC family oxidoreductase [Opitutaceae bacterium LMO-M01]